MENVKTVLTFFDNAMTPKQFVLHERFLIQAAVLGRNRAEHIGARRDSEDDDAARSPL